MGIIRLDGPPKSELCKEGVKVICASGGDQYVFHLAQDDFYAACLAGIAMVDAAEIAEERQAQIYPFKKPPGAH